MVTAEQAYIRTELERRHQRLQGALKSHLADRGLSALLAEVDAALSRIENGTYGLCEACHEPIERDRLLADPLVRFCLDDLTGDERRALEQDMALAAKIQRGLLPPRHASFSGWHVAYCYEPARVISGDYCDFFESNGDLLFLCGDVSGKGVAASMLMSHLHGIFRSLGDAELPLRKMVEAANRIFLESTLAEQFATLVVGRASPDGAVQFVSAGHLPVLHLSGESTNMQGSTGLPLGMFSNAQYSTHNLSLQPGSALLIYTDGLTEAQDFGGKEFGIERLTNFVVARTDTDPETLLADCLTNLKEFTAGTQQADDMTMLVIRRTSGTPSV